MTKPQDLAEQIRSGFPSLDPQDPDVIEAHHLLAREAIATCLPFHGNASGRGVVICGGGVRYFPSAWVTVSMLRWLGCELPVQLWHFTGEMNDEMTQAMSSLGVSCVNATDLAQTLAHPPRILHGWELKAFALLHCPFEQVLLLDADSMPVVNPEFLFSSPEFEATGAVFWPDYWKFTPDDSVWKVFEVAPRDESQFESGQIVLDRKRSWAALNLSMHYNEHSDFYYSHIHGDKDTFHMAWHRLEQKYAMPAREIESLDATMCQHDFQGKRLFQHRNMDKWNLDGSNRSVSDFWFEEQCLQSLALLRERWNGEL